MEPKETLFEEYTRVTRPREDPQDIKEKFVKMSNSLLQESGVGEDEISYEDVKIDTVFNNIAYLEPLESEFELGINYRWWDSASPEGKYVVLLHEMTHIEETGHASSFWDTMVQFHLRSKDQYALIETLFDDEFDWSAADWYVVTMADIPNVEFDEECVQERRQKMADSLRMDDFDPFELTAKRISILEYEDTERIPLDSIAVSNPSDTTLYKYLKKWHKEPKSNVVFNNDDQMYYCEPPTVSPTESASGKRAVLVGEDRMELIARTVGQYEDNPSIPVRVAREKPE